jgi:cytochrome c oxidase assembly protein subunit 15
VKTRQRPQSREVALSVIRTLALATWASTVALIVLGSAVRVTNSGMGCRGWPLCTGAQGSIASFHPVMEESHRLLASIVTILIVTLAWSVRHNVRARQLRGPSTVAVAVIVVQIVLGAVTVFAHNAPYTVALHLLTATLFLAVVSVVAVAAFLAPEESWSLRHGLGALAWAAVTALYVVVISGSVVVNAGAEAACASWPVCLHSPAPTSLLIVQMLHRSLVLVASVLVVAFAVSSLRARRESRGERTLAKVALVLLCAQIAVGAMSAIWSTHSEVADVHLAMASLLWSSVVMLAALRARDLDVVRAPSAARAVGSVHT